MSALTDVAPERFIADFFNSFTEQALGDEDAGTVVDRFYTPDVVQVSDGARFDHASAVSTEVYLFGAVTPDGRIRRVDQLTRTVRPAPGFSAQPT